MTPDLSRLRSLAEAATPGPWLSCECESMVRTGDMYAADGYTSVFTGFEVIGQDDKVVHSPDDGIQEHHDAAFIAAANPEVVISLIDQIEGLRAALVEAKSAMAGWGAYADEYFQQRHDLDGDLRAIDQALSPNPSTDRAEK